MKIKITSLANKKTSDIELNDSIFGCEIRKDILFRLVEWQRAKKQSGNHKTQEVGDVTGTTKKPFAQKGTGNARQGNKKGPHMKGGAVAHGPRVRSHAHKLTKKFRNLGLKTALSLKASEGKLHIFSDAKLNDQKTKGLIEKLSGLGFSSALFIDGQKVDENFLKASGNLHGIDVLPQAGINVYDILNHDNLILTVDAVKHLEKRLV